MSRARIIRAAGSYMVFIGRYCIGKYNTIGEAERVAREIER